MTAMFILFIHRTRSLAQATLRSVDPAAEISGHPAGVHRAVMLQAHARTEQPNFHATPATSQIHASASATVQNERFLKVTRELHMRFSIGTPVARPMAMTMALQGS